MQKRWISDAEGEAPSDIKSSMDGFYRIEFVLLGKRIEAKVCLNRQQLIITKHKEIM